MHILFTVIDWTLFLLLGGSVLYLFVFAVGSLCYRRAELPAGKRTRRFVVLIPAYKGDDAVGPAIEAAAAQEYPTERFRVAVVADKFRPDSLARLAREGVELWDVDFDESSKARALRYAAERLGPDAADAAVILDADNLVRADFLARIDDAFEGGATALQCHRKALNRDTDTAVLDALSEEINNSIFRRGHVALGLSSALIGSGMAFDYAWFFDRVQRLSTAGEDKELEALLLGEGRFIDYLDHVEVLDEKTRRQSNFYNQRRRWLAAQFHSLGASLGHLPGALVRGNLDYADKLLQWAMPPRILLLGTIPLIGFGELFIHPAAAAKWFAALLVLLFALAFATPDYLFDERTRRALRRTPVLFLLMAANLFRLRGASRRFIHTDHGDATADKPQS